MISFGRGAFIVRGQSADVADGTGQWLSADGWSCRGDYSSGASGGYSTVPHLARRSRGKLSLLTSGESVTQSHYKRYLRYYLWEEHKADRRDEVCSANAAFRASLEVH